MASASSLRRQIEFELAERIPAALSQQPRTLQPLWPTGIEPLDTLLGGGLPAGAITEISGPEGSGRTTIAISFVAEATQAGRICAWVDVSDTLSPEAAAAAGIQLDRLLWVRCGKAPHNNTAPDRKISLPPEHFTPAAPLKDLHGGGFGSHPRTELKHVAQEVQALLQPTAPTSAELDPLPLGPRCAEPQRRARHTTTSAPHIAMKPSPSSRQLVQTSKPWARIEQALRATDLLLHTGGFSVIVLDMASIAAEASLRVPLPTWFRYRTAAERAQASILLLTQTRCAKSSAGLALQMGKATSLAGYSTVMTGFTCHADVVRERFTATPKVVTLRKPPVRKNAATWQAQCTWTGTR